MPIPGPEVSSNCPFTVAEVTVNSKVGSLVSISVALNSVVEMAVVEFSFTVKPVLAARVGVSSSTGVTVILKVCPVKGSMPSVTSKMNESDVVSLSSWTYLTLKLVISACKKEEVGTPRSCI